MKFQNVGLSAVGGGLAIFGLSIIDSNFWFGLIGVVVGAGLIVLAAILNGKGIIVGK